MDNTYNNVCSLEYQEQPLSRTRNSPKTNGSYISLGQWGKVFFIFILTLLF